MLDPGDVVEFVSPWSPLKTEDGVTTEVRFHSETGLFNIGSRDVRLMRYGGKYFNRRHADVWVDLRIGTQDDGEMVYSDPEEAALRFGVQDSQISSCREGVVAELAPDTEDWTDMEKVLDALEQGLS
jgi:hypothetical protein